MAGSLLRVCSLLLDAGGGTGGWVPQPGVSPPRAEQSLMRTRAGATEPNEGEIYVPHSPSAKQNKNS